MTAKTILLTFLVLLTAGSFVAFGQDAEALFAKGNDLYRQGKFTDAANAYEQIIKEGRVSAPVYFNLGNAYYRQGKIALAILSYERAQRLKPGDADIVHNLRLLNLKTLDRIEPVPDLFLIQWLRTYAAVVPVQTAFPLLLAGWALFFVALAGVYVVRHTGILRLLRWGVLVGLAVVLFAGATLGIHSMLSNDNDQAVITASIVTAKSSPDEQSVNAFVVHEGLKVKVSDNLGDWVKITLADGKVGWIHNEQCERI